MKQIIFIAVIGMVLLGVSIPVKGGQTTTGRYQAIPMPPSDENLYGNFLWVMDTATGEVTAYRMGRTEKRGRPAEWVIKQVLTEEEIKDNLDTNDPDKSRENEE